MNELRQKSRTVKALGAAQTPNAVANLPKFLVPGSAENLPKFLQPLAQKLATQSLSLGAEAYLRRPHESATIAVQSSAAKANAQSAKSSAKETAKESAVMLILNGTKLENLTLLFQERAHHMRSQPGQYSFPGGKVDPVDLKPIHAASREVNEELGLNFARWQDLQLQILGEFKSVLLPFRKITVTPVLAWSPLSASEFLNYTKPNPAEVASLYPAKILGAASLSDPSVLVHAAIGQQPVGLAFDLPADNVAAVSGEKLVSSAEPASSEENPFIWGFTAALSAALLAQHLIPGKQLAELYQTVISSPVVKQVPKSRAVGQRISAS